MSDPAVRKMTLDEFLGWDDGTDTRYELVGGVALAMAPPARAHGMLCARLAGIIDAALRSRRPCVAQVEAGIPDPDRDDSCFIADLAINCRRHETGEQLVREPILIVEILSPGTERHDRCTKLPAYRQIGSVEEILLIDSDGHYAELHRRENERWLTELARGPDAVLRLASVDLAIPMAELYDGIAVSSAAEG